MPLSRRNPNLNKNDFGHVLVVAGSPTMLGAAALTSLAAMRAGVGLVTAAVPKGLNLTLQKKIAHVVMTMPVAQTTQGHFAAGAYRIIEQSWGKYQSLALGPGMGRQASTQQLIRRLVRDCPLPMVVDADALNALAGHTSILLKAKGARILTPHEGEMGRLLNGSVKAVSANRERVARDFAKKYQCVLLLKGPRTCVASPDGKLYINKTGNVGMATAGSGDVLTGIIAALLAQGLDPFKAACQGAHHHGQAADQAIKKRSKASLIALDIIEEIGKE